MVQLFSQQVRAARLVAEREDQPSIKFPRAPGRNGVLTEIQRPDAGHVALLRKPDRVP